MIFVSCDEEPPSINPASFLIPYQCIWRISDSVVDKQTFTAVFHSPSSQDPVALFDHYTTNRAGLQQFI